MKIAVVSSLCLPVGTEGYKGLERIVYYLAKGYKELGHEVTVFGAKGSVVPHGVELVEVSDADWSLSAEFKYAELDFSGFDFIHDNTWLHLPALRYGNALATHHAPDPPLPLVVRFPERLVCVSKAHSDYIENRYGVKPRFVHHGLEIEDYPFRVEKEDYVLFLNRISVEKGALSFANICEELGLKGIIAGEDVNVEDRHYVWKVIKACRNYCEFWGRVDEKEKLDLLSHAKAVVSLSGCEKEWLEVFGLFALESLSCGTPVLAYRKSGGVLEIIDEGSGAIFSYPYELGRLVKLDFDPYACRRRAEQFTYKKMVEKLSLIHI